MRKLVHVWKDINKQLHSIACILLMKRSKNMLNVLRILQVDVLTENVDMQTGGRVAKMRGLGNTNDSPNT